MKRSRRRPAQTTFLPGSASSPREKSRLPGLVALAAVAAVSSACGGGVPLMHPARTLNAGDVRATGGVSANLATGSLGGELNAASAEVGSLQGPPVGDPAYARGALVQAIVAPGLAPFVAGRVGVGAQLEAGLTYTGRGARVDLRRSFTWDSVSLSVGAGASAIFYGSEPSGGLPYVDLSSIHGYGADIPVLIGWESGARLFMAWAGVRAGVDHAEISALTSQPETVLNTEVELEATRFYGGAVAGFAAGFRHVHVALEFDVAYQTISGSYDTTQATISGVSLSPAAALWVDF